jgi:hypothetical protein
MTAVDAFMTNCRLADGRPVDIGIADGKIAIVGEGAAPASSNSVPVQRVNLRNHALSTFHMNKAGALITPFKFLR